MVLLRRAVAVMSAILIVNLSVQGVADAAPAVTCGATLKVNSTLTKDLSCPKGNGITLYRGVTLNLGGHKLIGPGIASGIGVTLSAKGGSVLTNGTVQGWKNGVVQDYTTEEAPAPSQINKVTLVNAAAAFNTGQTVTVSGSSFTSSPLTNYSGTLNVSSSKFVKSLITAGLATTTITASTITGSGVKNASGGMSIDQSVMDGTGYTGPIASCSDDSLRISNSTVKNYAKPISGWWCYVFLQTNTFSNNPGGVVLDIGASELDPQGSLAAYGNTFKTSGIVIQSNSMIVAGNTFSNNTTGIVPTSPATTTITGNTFANNTSSGIRATADGLILGSNRAINNGGYGIYAPNAVDQGGNVAYGNKRGQCVGLTCSSN